MDKANQDYVLAGSHNANDPVVEGVTVPSDDPAAFGVKRGHKCCGGCCDVRRATIIVNIISVCLDFFGLMAFFAVTGMTKNASNNFDDDEVVAAFEELEGYTTSVRVAIALSCTKMVLNAAGIYGAVTYKVWAVAASLVGYGIEFVVSLIGFDLLTLLMAGFFAYPHYHLIQEIRSGVMSRETYEQEKFSCCCV